MSNPYVEWLSDLNARNEIYEKIVEKFCEFHLDFAIQNKIAVDDSADNLIIMAIAYADWEREISIIKFACWEDCAKWCYDELDWYEKDNSDCIDDVEEVIEELKSDMEDLFKEAEAIYE